jgi:uncharacterized protein
LNATGAREYNNRVARAGFWAVSSGAISFGRDGRWYSDGEPINNARIALLFSRCLRQTDDGRWQIAMADERAFVTIEDTPWVVTAVEREPAGEIRLRLNDASDEPLDPATLAVGSDNVLYTRVKGGHRARFLRPAYYQLAPAIEERDGRFVLVTGTTATAIAPARV